MKWLGVVLVALSVLASGCVTTTDSRFQREADRDEALKNYVKLATAYIGQGNLERARHHLDRALEIDDRYAPALAAEGLVYSSDGEAELAEKSFRRALAADNDYSRGRVYYGAFLYSQGKLESARDQFEAATLDADYEDRSSVFYNLGMTEERLRNLEAARQAYQRAVELSRGDVRSLLSLSRVLVAQNEYAAASRYYSRLERTIRNTPRLEHSPESLLIGITIAREFGDRDQEASMALMLRNRFADSDEYQQYKALTANDQ